MNYRLYKHIYWIFALSFLFTGCDDYLDSDRTSGTISSDLIWKSPTAINGVLANMYDQGLKLDEFDDWYGGRSNLTNQTSLSDEATASYQKDNAFSNANAVYTYGDYIFNNDFENCYKHIRNTNTFIVKLSETSVLSDTEKALLDAEARFIRTMQYFSLVKRYGGVPILTKPQEYNPDNFESMYTERNREVEVYDFIINECKAIWQTMPETRKDSEKYRATRGAVLALWSRAALYAGSIARYSDKLSITGTAVARGYVLIENTEAERFFTESYNASVELLKMVPTVYDLRRTTSTSTEDLSENFYNIFSKAGNNGDNKEYIFFKKYDAAEGKGHMWDKLNTPFSYRGDGWGCGMSPVLEMVEEFEYRDGTEGKLKIQNGNTPIEYNTPFDLFENKDPRLLGSIYVPGSPCRGTNIEWMRGVINGSNGSGAKHRAQAQPDQTNIVIIGGVTYSTSGKDGGADTGDASKTGFYQRKFIDESLADLTNIDAKRSETPWVVFRLAETYLNLAEACMELGGKDQEALAAINEIRERAGVKTLTSITLERVRHERKVELAFERLRYWDLKRWRTAHLDASQGGLTNFRGTALYPWYNIVSGKYTFETGIPPKQKRLFLEKNYYTRIRPEDLSRNPKMVQNPGFGN